MQGKKNTQDAKFELLQLKLQQIGFSQIYYQFDTENKALTLDKITKSQEYFNIFNTNPQQMNLVMFTEYPGEKYSIIQEDGIMYIYLDNIKGITIKLPFSAQDILIKYKSEKNSVNYIFILRLNDPEEYRWDQLLKLDQIDVLVDFDQLSTMIPFQMVLYPKSDVDNMDDISILTAFQMIAKRANFPKFLNQLHIQIPVLSNKKYIPNLIDYSSHQYYTELYNKYNGIRGNYNISKLPRLTLNEIQQYLFNLLLIQDFDLQYHINDRDITLTYKSSNDIDIKFGDARIAPKRIKIEDWIQTAVYEYFGQRNVHNSLIQQIMNINHSISQNQINFILPSQTV